MARSVGVVTAVGALASHAAVVARGWGIPAVVGAGDIVHELVAGERISIDGSTGEIFRGDLDGEWHVAPEASTLLFWAYDLGIEVVAASEDVEAEKGGSAVTSESRPEITVNDVVLALAIKGSSTLEQLAESVAAEIEAIQAALEQLYESAFVETDSGQLRLTPTGKLEAADLFVADCHKLGTCDDLVDEFHPFDSRMKEIVTAWQVRDVAGEQVLNDHTDAAYDARILDELANLHIEVAAWLEPVAGNLRRFAVYRSRLDRALGLCQSGDQRFVASPRVDSYHSVWFELHEDLIRLSGKKRSDVTAG